MLLRVMIPLTLFVAGMMSVAFDSLTLAVVLGAAAFLVAIFFPIGLIPRRAISLESIAIAALAGYSLSVPLHQVIYNDYREETILEALYLCLVAGAAFVMGNCVQRARRAHKFRPPIAERSIAEWKKYYQVGWMIFLFGTMSAVLAVAITVGFDAYFSAGYAGRSLLKRQAGPIELGLYHAVLGLAFVNLARLQSPALKSRKILFLAIVLITAIYVVYVSFLGIRRPSFFLVLTMVMLYGIAGRGFARWKLLVFGVPVILAFALFANFRQILTDQGSSAAISFVRTNSSFEWFDLSRTELGAPFRVIVDVMDTWEVDDLRLGVTFASTLPYVLPRAAGLPVTSLSQEYTSRNFSQSFISMGGNMGFSPVAEGYINYGVLGVAGYFIIIGYIMSSIQWNAINRRCPTDLIAFAIAAPWFVFFIRTDLASFAKVFLYSVAVPYVISLVLLMLWSKARVRP